MRLPGTVSLPRPAPSSLKGRTQYSPRKSTISQLLFPLKLKDQMKIKSDFWSKNFKLASLRLVLEGDEGKCSTRKVFDRETGRQFRVLLGWLLSDNFCVGQPPAESCSG